MGKLRNQAGLTIHDSWHEVLSPRDYSELGISVTSQTAVVNVGRSTKNDLIIDDHEFGVQVYDLSGGLAELVESAVVPEAEKL